MTTQQPQSPRTTASWREAALARSEIITDAWEVTKTYAGRIAEWVLFLCMVMNIIEILVTLPSALSNIVLGTQVVMLDVGGFNLASMGDQARQQGDEQAARRASVTGNFLIGVTIVTLLLVTIGLLFPPAKQYTDMAEMGLILVRVGLTVIYSHVIHSLRRAGMQGQHATFTEHITELSERLTASEQRMTELVQAHTRTLTELAALPALCERLQQELQAALEANSEHQHRLSVPNTARRPKLLVVEANTEHRKTEHVERTVPKATTGRSFGTVLPTHRIYAMPIFSVRPANRVSPYHLPTSVKFGKRSLVSKPPS